MALNNINLFLEPNLKKINKNISIFEEFIKQQDVITDFIPPKAGSTSFVQLNINDSSLEFSNQLVKDTGIMTVPAEMFEYEGKYIRVGFGRANLPEILEVLERYLKQMPAHNRVDGSAPK